jgi:hypothetical protein
MEQLGRDSEESFSAGPSRNPLRGSGAAGLDAELPGSPVMNKTNSRFRVYVADFYLNTIRKEYVPPRILNSSFNLGQSEPET